MTSLRNPAQLVRSLAPARALMRKDLRTVAPLLLGLGTLTVFASLAQVLFEPATAATWVDASTWGSTEGMAAAVVSMITALLAALVLFAGERDARTAEFVATLPVDPLLVVASKFVVVAAVTVAFLCGDLLADWCLAFLNPEPMAHRALTVSTFLWRFGLTALVAVIWAAHAVWLSSYGRLAWVIVVLFVLATSVVGGLSPLWAPVRLDGPLQVTHHGTVPQFPWRAVLFHGGLAALALVAGAQRWVRAHGVPPRRAVVDAPWRPRLAPALLLVGLVLLTGVIVIFAGDVEDAVHHAEEQAEHHGGEGDDPGAPRAATDQLQTRHFTFTFLPGDAATAHTLATEADALYNRVAKFTGVQVPGRIIADLTFSGVEAAGLALGSHLTVDVSGQRSPEDLRHVFVHELLHVFEGALAPRARLAQRASLRFVAEGFAEHVAFELLDRRADRRRALLQAAWARQRYHLRLRDLFDTGRFVALYDERWLYDFGQRWVAALSATCGRAAPMRFFQGLDDPALPSALLGAELTRHLLARARCDLDQVEAAFETDLRAAEPALTDVPRLRARFRERTSSTFSFDVRVDGPPGKSVPVTLLMRADVTTSPRAYVVQQLSLVPGAVQRIKAEAPALDDRSFQYRIGVDGAEGGRYFTRWRSALRE